MTNDATTEPVALAPTEVQHAPTTVRSYSMPLTPGVGGEGDRSAQSQPCADAGTHIPRSPEAQRLLVRNDAKHLRGLLTDLYAAVLGYLPTDDTPLVDVHRVPLAAWDTLMTTVLDAAEGRNFVPLTLPWPPSGEVLSSSRPEGAASALPPDDLSLLQSRLSSSQGKSPSSSDSAGALANERSPDETLRKSEGRAS